MEDIFSHIKLVKQEGDKDCGHACLAMILGVPLKTVKSSIKAEILSSHILESELRKNGYQAFVDFKLVGRDLVIPHWGILNYRFKKDCGHWVVKNGDRIFCPHYGEHEIDDYAGKDKVITSTISIIGKTGE